MNPSGWSAGSSFGAQQASDDVGAGLKINQLNLYAIREYVAVAVVASEWWTLDSRAGQRLEPSVAVCEKLIATCEFNCTPNAEYPYNKSAASDGGS